MADKHDDQKPAALVMHDFPERRDFGDAWLHYGNVKKQLADGVMGPEEERLWWEAHRAQEAAVGKNEDRRRIASLVFNFLQMAVNTFGMNRDQIEIFCLATERTMGVWSEGSELSEALALNAVMEEYALRDRLAAGMRLAILQTSSGLPN